MPITWLVLLLASGMLTLRWGGIGLARLHWPAAWDRMFAFVPIAALTALIVTSLSRPEHDTPARVLAAAGAAFIARRTGRIWACIAGGMALLWLLRLL